MDNALTQNKGRQSHTRGTERSPEKKRSRWSVFLSTLRSTSKKIKVNTALHLFRRIIHYGPWRAIPIWLIQKARPPRPIKIIESESLLPSQSIQSLVSEIKQNSYALAEPLPQVFTQRVRDITDQLPFNEYHLVHTAHPLFHQIATDPVIVSVVQNYLNAEPALLESSLFVSGAEGQQLLGQNLFHFDYAGWDSLNVFIYLTDITEHSCYHQVIKGSHRGGRILDVIRRPLSESEAKSRFGDSVESILGPAGTVFFETTEAFHRRHLGEGRRVMLNLLYASHKSLLSYGRASNQDIEMRNREFSKFISN